MMAYDVAQSVQWLGYGLHDLDSIPGRGSEGIYFVLHSVQTDS
jgi:hypothetical protein